MILRARPGLVADRRLDGLAAYHACRPSSPIRRCTVQRATCSPSRSNCRQTLRTPYTWKCSSQTRWMCSPSSWSRCARADCWLGSAC
uniref:Uncharacterized protein n=1 Tax=Pseudomonas savastanoi TaxID=29438 RepID=Q52506_PSESS|nr:unknown protein [Pseudomonas savastanoi]